jgi:hypothetical protein
MIFQVFRLKYWIISFLFDKFEPLLYILYFVKIFTKTKHYEHYKSPAHSYRG